MPQEILEQRRALCYPWLCWVIGTCSIDFLNYVIIYRLYFELNLLYCGHSYQTLVKDLIDIKLFVAIEQLYFDKLECQLEEALL